MELQEEAGSQVLPEQGRIGVFSVKCLLTTTHHYSSFVHHQGLGTLH